MKNTLIALSLATAIWASPSAVQAADSNAQRPNILWITCEDMSPNLGCFGDPYARTPNLDAFAREAVRFTCAYATAPVCSPVRSCLITGLYATSLGTQRLRSQFPIPAGFRGYAAYLREAGYYCSNNVKTDYNFRNEPAFIRDAWDECSNQAHWRKRKPGQPFFAIFNLTSTHQSQSSAGLHAAFEKAISAKLSPDERHDPAKANLPPYYPDTAESRRTWARYHDCITAMDKQAAAILKELEADGLAQDTIVFFYPDHGMGMPRGKRTLYDSGLRVPLMIRFPAKYAPYAPAPAGSSSDRLVSFLDFAPTVLTLCGLPVPAQMQGTPFLGPKTGAPRAYVFGARDRVDEAYDLSRSVSDGRFLLIRNFMPHLSWMQPERFSDQSEFRREFKQLAAAGKLGRNQLGYAAERRPLEELYDTSKDPHQIHNLADDPAAQGDLQRLRSALKEGMISSRDTGFLTEPQMWDRMGEAGSPFELAKDAGRYPLEKLLAAADLVGRPGQASRQAELLKDADDGVRYWAAMGLRAAGPEAVAFTTALKSALQDASFVVRIEAAAALVGLGETAAGLPVLEAELGNTRGDVALHAARALELLGENARPVLPSMKKVLAANAGKTGDSAMYIRFSLEAALENLEGSAPKPAAGKKAKAKKK